MFNLFDENSSGAISNDEFKRMLLRLKLLERLPESQIPTIIAMFDKKKKGYINVDDFLAFVDANKDMTGTSSMHLDDDDDGDDGEAPGLSSNTPPAAITKVADCDWLAWFLWREACKVEPVDPESVITELEATCTETQLAANQGVISAQDLWNILGELKLRGNMIRPQFDKSIVYLIDGKELSSTKKEVKGTATGKDADQVDYEALCRYTVRMGRAYNQKIQERRAEDMKKFESLLQNIKKDFTAMITEAATTVSAPG